MNTCRCGYTGEGPHPCHGQGYTCRRPATRRLYEQPAPYSLAGMQPKISAVETWACQECWRAWTGTVASIPVDGECNEGHR